MTTVTVSGFKIRKGERLYGTYVRYALYKATKVELTLFGLCIYHKYKKSNQFSKQYYTVTIRYNTQILRPLQSTRIPPTYFWPSTNLLQKYRKYI